QPGMMQALRVQRVGERTNHVILTDQGIERTRPPLACQYQIRHGDVQPDSCRNGREKCTRIRQGRGPGEDTEMASLTSALILHDYGCFVPDLTRFAAEPCEGARHERV